MSKPILRILYEGISAEIIPPIGYKLEDLPVEIKLEYYWEEEAHVITYKGIKVYRAVRNPNTTESYLSEYWLTPYMPDDWEGDSAFDRRDLPKVPKDSELRNDTNLTDDLQIRLAYAITEGWLTNEGLHLPEDAVYT